jgi:hypothetical protein
MSWAARRRLIILLIVGALVVAFLASVSIATFYQTPSCTDGRQNQGESGVDCGGPCSYLCLADTQSPTVLFTKAVSNSAGRTDIVALVENKNATAAAKNIPYRVQLYGADRALVREISGTLDLPPGATVPVFIPGVSSGKQIVTGAFLTIDPSAPKWFALVSDTRIVPRVSNMNQTGTIDAPRVEAVLTNASVTTLTGVPAIVLVRNEQGGVIAASQTIVPIIPAQGSATATFTWDSAFPSTPASIEVVPMIPLP